MGRGHRRLCVLEGERDDCVRRADERVGDLAPEQVVRIATDADRRARVALLGREATAAIVDLHPGFDPDLLGAVHGVVRGGGEIVLLTPPLADWPLRRGPVEERLAVWPHGADEVGARLTARFASLLAGRHAPDVAPAPDTTPPWEPTRGQAEAVEAIRRMGAPVVLTSDRGRGKSTALGLAACALVEDGASRVVVTAPTRRAAEAGLRAVDQRLDPVRASRVRFAPAADAVEMITPDDALLVDEAAALAVPVLERLLEATPRIAFATTVHGYEGSGRGFVLRFLETLRARHPDAVELHLTEPVRWDAGDPVEALVHGALLLDAEPSALEVDRDVGARAFAHDVVDRELLASDEDELRAVFGLLVHAHYRTTPADLRRLLDAPNLELHVLRHGPRIGAAALVAAEGGLPSERCQAMYTGARRLRGHAIPENLVCHLALPEAGELTVRRVVRIATHPALRRRGLGRRLLDRIADHAATQGVDLVGSVFGATADLLAFWTDASHRLLRLSVARGAASGEHSALVALPLSPEAERTVAWLRGRFARDLPHALGDALRGLDPDLALDALRGLAPGAEPDLDEADRRELEAYAFGARPYDVTARAASALVEAHLTSTHPTGTPDEHRLLVAKVLQRRRWQEVQRLLGYPSVPATMRALRAAVGPMLAGHDS